MRYSVEHRGNVTIVRIRYRGTFEQRFLLTADRHWDNPRSCWGLQGTHLDLAIRKRAGIIDFGDFFCAMQGKYDKRANKSALRPMHRVDDYFDALVDTAHDFFERYATRFIRISRGNHETAILKNHETDLVGRLVAKLNQKRGANVVAGGYSGWIHFIFEDEVTGEVSHKKLWYIHGYGGGGPVTKGVIQSNRQAVYVPDADIVVNGHIHESWQLAITRTRLTNDSTQHMDEQLHVRLPSYKEEYGDGSNGWHVERGGPPKPIGAGWLTFQKESEYSEIEATVTRAR